MNIQHFDDLLQVARAQTSPQRLLLVFADVELPADPSAQQRAEFAAGRGGTLMPRMCVDKDPSELNSFDALVREAEPMGQRWHLVFAAALDGKAQCPPDAKQVEACLQAMVEAIQLGELESYLAFDAQGVTLQLG